MKDSAVAKQGTIDFANGHAKQKVLPNLYEQICSLSRDQYEREALIARNLELVMARAED